LNMWQDITVKGGDFKDKYSESEFEINLVDKNTNSLKQLNQYIDKISVPMMRGYNRMSSVKGVTIEQIDKDEPKVPPAPEKK